MRALTPALTAVALWSTNAAVARHALAEMPVALVQLLQFTGAAAIFVAAAPAGGGPASRREPLPLAAFAIGLIGFVGTMLLQYLAFATMPVGRANLIAYSWPLMAAAAFIALGRAVRPWRLGLLSCIGFLGTAILVTDNADHGAGVLLPGVLAAAGSAACMAFYTVAIGRYAAEARRLLMPSALVGAALCLAWCIVSGVDAAPSPGWLFALYLGTGPMGLGYLLWSSAMGRDKGGRLAVLAYLTPVFSTTLLAADGEPFDGSALVGAALVVVASLAAGMEKREKPSHG